jgi:hypothetical protein
MSGSNILLAVSLPSFSKNESRSAINRNVSGAENLFVFFTKWILKKK